MAEKRFETWDELTVNAYLDGQLDDETRRQLELAMEEDDGLKVYVQNRRRLDGLLQGTYSSAMERPLSPGLADMLSGTGREAAGNVSVHRSGGWMQGFLALAAGLVIMAIGFGAGFLTGEASMERQQLAMSLERNSSLQNMQVAWNSVLENTPSGEAVVWGDPESSYSTRITPIRTMRTRDNRYCREFREVRLVDGIQEERRGISCRSGKEQWQLEALFPEGKRSYF
ncbi:MAG: RT0821/Lpp0805 family surface protein [Sedimenticola sp.]